MAKYKPVAQATFFQKVTEGSGWAWPVIIVSLFVLYCIATGS